VRGQAVGWIGELHPRLQQKYEIPGPLVVFEVDAAPLQEQPLPVYREVPKFPAVTRDLAMTFPDSVPVQAIFDHLAVHKAPLVDSIRLFDLYRGPGVDNGRKSLAFRVLLQDTQKTMTDPEVESAVAQLVLRLEQQFNAKLRD
jgi:phenylalanyl-tRNA synthetase beta chain